MAGQKRLLRSNGADCLEVAGILVHLASADLEGLHVRQLGKLDQQLGREGRTRIGGVDVHNQREPARLSNRREILDDVLIEETEAKPMMGRHDVEPGSASPLGPTGLFYCVVNAF